MNLPSPDLRGRWQALSARLRARCADADPDALERLGDALLAAWSEPHRAYHTRDHLAACLAELDSVLEHAVDADAIALGLWFHDAVYDPIAADNEARSAAWAHTALTTLGLPTGLVATVEALVLATRHDEVPQDPDAALLVDIDLSILGQPAARFDAYERAVRVEYARVPTPLYVAGRGRVLASLLARPRLYTTPWMARRYEAAARANLARSLAALTTDPAPGD